MKSVSPPTLYKCYYTEADVAVRERLWLHVRATGGWLSAHPWGLLLFCREGRDAPLLLLDPEISRRPQYDYID